MSERPEETKQPLPGPPATAVEAQQDRTKQQAARLLIVEDDQDLATILAEHLAETLGAEVTVAGSCHEAVDVELSRPQDLILADLYLPDGDAIGLMRQLQGISEVPFVLMSGVPTIGRVVEAMRLGAADFLSKPFELSHLTSAVSHALGKHRQQERMRIRYQRMRRLAKQILRDRRQLQERVDLVCRDLVHAYRRLAKRVVELYEMYGEQQDG